MGSIESAVTKNKHNPWSAGWVIDILNDFTVSYILLNTFFAIIGPNAGVSVRYDNLNSHSDVMGSLKAVRDYKIKHKNCYLKYFTWVNVLSTTG